MVKLTNAEAAYVGRPIGLNPLHIVAVFEAFDDERRIQTIDGHQYIVSESFQEIMDAIPINK